MSERETAASVPLPAVDFHRLESLAAELTEVIHRCAATWETQFDAGPGDVVSVNDAAWVIARHLLTEDTGLAAAIADVGRIIEALPPHERKDRVARVLEAMPETGRRDVVVGICIWAHALRLAEADHA